MSLDYIYSDANQPLRMVVWDLGRRCNFDCTYCTGWMHSTTSPMKKFEEYKRTADFIDEYYNIYKDKHKGDWKINISFTGGEPSVNPAFYQLLPYLKEKYPYMRPTLTTNGTWGRRKGQFLLDHCHAIRVSYHAEGTAKQKELIRENLLFIREAIGDQTWKLKVNVMMHVDYFDECVDLIENFLKPNDIAYIPRTIGDDGRYRDQWFKDMDGQMRRTSHTYSPEQQDYIKNHWKTQNTNASDARNKTDNTLSDDKKENTPPLIKLDKTDETGHINKMGRMCCGGRCMTVKKGNDVDDAMFIEQSNFKGWNCMINWFFLHIEEDRDAVYQHQTCMAKLPGTPAVKLDIEKFGDIASKFTDEVGPICTLSESKKYLDWLRTQFEDGKTPTMVCPKTHCGCGICVAKAKYDDDFEMIANKFIDFNTGEKDEASSRMPR